VHPEDENTAAPKATGESSYAQFGEDVLLWELFGRKTTGFFVEVGANHPTLCSNTYLLEERGWAGMLVEPLPANCAVLRKNRPRSHLVQAALGAPEQQGSAPFYVVAGRDSLSGLGRHAQEAYSEIQVEVRTLDDVLEQASPPPLDLVSIDVEGFELQVLQGFSLERYRPRVLLLEDHLQSLQVHRHVSRHGYRLVKRTGCNSWYVPRDSTFPLSSWSERFALRKEILLDTPVRILRFALKRRWARSRRSA
jgi:FkbM family methyltransferase